MPRPAKGARLYLKAQPGRPATWVIRDGPIERSTGCGARDGAGAEKALEKYLAEKHRPHYGNGDPDKVQITDILIAHGKTTTDVVATYSLPVLAEFWDGRTLAAITPDT